MLGLHNQTINIKCVIYDLGPHHILYLSKLGSGWHASLLNVLQATSYHDRFSVHQKYDLKKRDFLTLTFSAHSKSM